MRPLLRLGGEFSAPLVGAVLLTLPSLQTARAEGILALAETGVANSSMRGACRDALGGDGRCPGKSAAPVRIERPLFAVVSIGDQTVSIYNHQGLVTRSEVSTGMAGHATPKGVFTIIGRERLHSSNIYSGAPMPFMQRLTWSGIAMHLGVVPGHPASHGCIRLPAGFAAKLWGMTRIGERVVIAPQDVTPTEFDHPLLPAPKMQVVADAGPAASAPATPQAVTSSPEPPRLNPRQYAERLKAKATADRIAAAKTSGEAFLAADATETDALRLAEELKPAEAADAAAQSKAESAAKLADAAAAAAEARRDDAGLIKARDEANAARAKANEERAAAAAKLEAARKAVADNAAVMAEAYRRWQAAAKAFEAAENAEKDAELRMSPVSVLISKADKRVYVRQGLAPIFDAPAIVRDPKSPLGSHLYIATAAGADGNSLKWSVISLPPSRADDAGEGKKGKKAEEDDFDSLSYSSMMSGSAESALERVEIAQDVRDRIAERLWTGASIIISDQPLSGETNNVGTDLTVKFR